MDTGGCLAYARMQFFLDQMLPLRFQSASWTMGAARRLVMSQAWLDGCREVE